MGIGGGMNTYVPACRFWKSATKPDGSFRCKKTKKDVICDGQTNTYGCWETKKTKEGR